MASKKKLMHKKILTETVQVWQKMKGRKPFYRNPYTMHKIVFTMVIIAKNAISFRINCVFYVFGHNPTSSTDLFFFSFFIWLLESIKRTRKMSYFFFFFRVNFHFQIHFISIGLNCVTREESSQ